MINISHCSLPKGWSFQIIMSFNLRILALRRKREEKYQCQRRTKVVKSGFHTIKFQFSQDDLIN